MSGGGICRRLAVAVPIPLWVIFCYPGNVPSACGVDLTPATIPTGKWYCKECSSGCKAKFSQRKPSNNGSVRRKSSNVTTSQALPEYTLENAISDHRKILSNAVDDVLSDPMLQLNEDMEEDIVKVLTTMKDTSCEANDLGVALIKELWQSAESVKESNLSLDIMCTTFHSLSLGSKIPLIFDNYLESRNLCIPSRPKLFLSQFLLDSLIKCLLQAKLGKACTEVTTDVDLSITKEEQQVLRYIAGYVPFHLQKFYSKFNSNFAQACLDAIQDWKSRDSCVDSNSFLHCTRKWIDLVNRGGLYSVNDNFYLFIRRIENEARKNLKIDKMQSYRDVNLKQNLVSALYKSASIADGWNIVSNHIENCHVANSLFGRIIDSYASIRCRSYANVYMYLRKLQDQKVSKKGEKSLRKQLCK